MKSYKLKDICTLITDGSHYSPDSVKHGLPIASVKDMHDFGIEIDTCRRISKGEFEKLVKGKCQPQIGDVLIAKDGSYLKHAFVVEENPDYVTLSSIGIFRPNPSIVNSYYLKYQFLNRHFRNYVTNGFVSGTALKRIVLKAFKEIKIQLPDLQTQNMIVDQILPIDKLIQNNKDLLRKLEEYSQLLFHKWFNDFNFPNEEGNPYMESGGKMSEVEGRIIPMGWRYDRVTVLGEVIGGGTPSSTNQEYFTEQGIAWITPKDLSNNSDMYIIRGERDISELGLMKSSARLMPKRSVLMSSRAPIGYLTISRNEVCTNQGFKSIVPKNKKASEFIYYTLKGQLKKLHLISSGSTFAEVSKEMIERLKVVLPPDNLIDDFYNKLEPVFNKIEDLSDEQTLLLETRNLLIRKLIN